MRRVVNAWLLRRLECVEGCEDALMVLNLLAETKRREDPPLDKYHSGSKAIVIRQRMRDPDSIYR